MIPFVGVKPFTTFDIQTLKRELLLFDQLLIPGLKTIREAISRSGDSRAIADVDWLQVQNLIGEAELLVNEKNLNLLLRFEQDYTGHPYLFTRCVAQWIRERHEVDAAVIESHLPLRSRRFLVERNSNTDKTFWVDAACESGRHKFAFPAELVRFDNTYSVAARCKIDYRFTQRLLETRYFAEDDNISAIDTEVRSTPLRIVLREFPQPSDSTSFEQLIEFKSDPAVVRDRLALRRWITSVATQKRTTVEILTELEHLRAEYEAHMQLHRMKAQKGVLETTIVGMATLAEDLVKIKWGKLAEGLFSVQHKNLALLEAEASAPGREVAYLVKASTRFATPVR